MKTILNLACVLALTGCGGSAAKPSGDANSATPAPVKTGCPAVADASLNAWSCVPSGTTKDLNRVWGSGPEDVWAVGAEGTILHWDGSAWTEVASGATQGLNGLWGSAASDVWAVGDQGTILHWDGAAWSADTSAGLLSAGLDGGPAALSSVWGSDASDVWVVGDARTILHWDGSVWSSAEPALPSGATQTLSGVWGSGPSDAWAVGTPSCHVDPQAVQSNWESPPQICADDAVLHWDGSAWSPSTPSPMCPKIMGCGGGALAEVWGSGAGDLWAAGPADAIYHSNGSVWVLASTPHGRDDAPTGMKGSPSGPQPSMLEPFIWDGLWGSGPNDVWAVGSAKIVHWDGSAWSAVTDRVRLNGVWGGGAGDVWAVGALGVILHE